MLRRVTYPTTIGLAASILSLGAPAPVQAQSVDCPDGAVVVLDGEQICFPYASGGVPMQGGPLQVQAPRGGGGTQEWCHRHDNRDHDSPTNPWRVHCKLGEDWWFIRDWDCYIRRSNEAPPEWEIPRWDIGPDEEGTLFMVRCYPPREAPPLPGEKRSTPYLDLEGRWQTSSFVLGPENPPGYNGTPSVIPQLWQEAINALGMRGPDITMAPPNGGALVNLPVWLWTETGGTTWPTDDPLHASAAASGQRVDAWAEPLRIEWNLGDGSTPLICHGPGQAWQPGLDFLSPGECHHVYRRHSRNQPNGSYQVTAITTWRVWWHINGQYDNELELQVGTTTDYEVHEIQVLTGRPRR